MFHFSDALIVCSLLLLLILLVALTEVLHDLLLCTLLPRVHSNKRTPNSPEYKLRNTENFFISSEILLRVGLRTLTHIYTVYFAMYH